MGTRGRVWRVGKWAGVIGSTALFSAWGLSVGYAISYGFPDGSIIALNAGTISYSQIVGPSSAQAALQSSDASLFASGLDVDPGWINGRWERIWLGFRLPYAWSAQPMILRDYPELAFRRWDLPLAAPFFAIAIPTALLWYRDRRRGIVGGVGMT